MNELAFAIDAGWGLGLVLAMTRVAAFVVASPILGKFVAMPGRLAFVVVVSLFLAEPVAGVATLPGLAFHGLVNAAVGGILGMLTGLVFHAFASAGGVVDISSQLSAAQVFDPARGEQGAVFSRLFHMAALALFVVAGGIGVLVAGLALSVRAVPLVGLPHLGAALPRAVVDLTSRFMVLTVELAIPVVAVLFLVEVVLGVASRFAPQANIFLVGIPVKLLVALSSVSLSVMIFPGAVDAYVGLVEDTFTGLLSSMR